MEQNRNKNYESGRFQSYGNNIINQPQTQERIYK